MTEDRDKSINQHLTSMDYPILDVKKMSWSPQLRSLIRKTKKFIPDHHKDDKIRE